jgi:hypothetical protein
VIEIITKVVLSPVLYAQANRVRATTLDLPEPDGPRSGSVGHGRPFRLLVVGDSSAVGVGAPHQDDAFAAPLARALAAVCEAARPAPASPRARSSRACAWPGRCRASWP